MSAMCTVVDSSQGSVARLLRISTISAIGHGIGTCLARADGPPCRAEYDLDLRGTSLQACAGGFSTDWNSKSPLAYTKLSRVAHAGISHVSAVFGWFTLRLTVDKW